MKLRNPGRNTLKAEVVQISSNGIWLLVNEIEHFLSFQDFPWFKDATVSQIHNVYFLEEDHLHWPDLDVDLELASLLYLDKYPLIYRS